MTTAFTIPVDIPVAGPTEGVKTRKRFRSTKIGKPISYAGMYTVAGFNGAVKGIKMPVHVAASLKDTIMAFIRKHPYLNKIAVNTAEIFAFLVAAVIAIMALTFFLGLLGLTL